MSGLSGSLLDRLRIKKLPQRFENVKVRIPKPQEKQHVTIKTRIVNKTNENIINPNDFMTTITHHMTTKNFTENTTQTPDQSKKPLSPIQENQNDTAPVPTAPVPTAPVPTAPAPTAPAPSGKPKLVIIRKLGEKIKLVQPKGIKPPVNLANNKRLTSKPSTDVIKEFPTSMVKIGDTITETRLGNKAKPENIGIQASSYYLANREKFISFVTSIFSKYKKELEESESGSTCDRNDESPFSPMGHQKIVRDYISKYSPYRGVLLYHGLGSGKTCSSIAIAEGLKTERQIIVMTPASLRMNYVEELKKCGDDIYKKNQFWEFIDTRNKNDELILQLSSILSLSTDYIKKKGGAWLVNVTKPPNFKNLKSVEKTAVDDQINEMIRHKYKFIKYNGLRKSHLKTLSEDYKINPFDNKVVIIDEAHNFVSRIVNKLGRKDTLSGDLYNYIMKAENARIVLLTGTPIINYPNEIAILFNMLRGFIKTWTFKLTIKNKGNITEKFFKDIFNNKSKSGVVMDYIEYIPTSTTLIITRNPFGFVNTTKNKAYNGINLKDHGQISDAEFQQAIIAKLKKESIMVNKGGINVNFYKPLPDTLDEFKSYFIDDKNEVKNMNLFKRRILGLSSYFRDMESLMPKYEKEDNFHVVKVEMSDYQLGVYESARKTERTLERNNAKKRKKQVADGPSIFDETVSTYRIFSRSFCNFVFPEEIERPLPGKNKDMSSIIFDANYDEDDLDGASVEDKLDNADGRYDADEVCDDEEKAADANRRYNKKIELALSTLEENKDKFLSKEALQTYSPKFLNILENVSDVDYRGLHLIYSQFRTLEGIGIMKMVFEANGYAQFKLSKKGGAWQIDVSEEDMEKPMFVLYTGTETSEEKEIIRNVFNGAWKYIPTAIEAKLKELSPNNLYGDIIKVLMITASGAEGISLKNVRYVHITEPYWHPVRTTQVIGRARRICSHQELPPNMRTVDVFLYLMTLSEAHKKSDDILELRRQDKSKVDINTPITSDEALYEIATLKENVTNQILHAVKEASFDCTLHAKVGDKEQLKCFTFGSTDPAKYSYQPEYGKEDSDNVAKQNQKTITFTAVEITLGNKKYALDKETNNIYDLESYNRNNPVQIGNLVITDDKKVRIVPV